MTQLAVRGVFEHLGTHDGQTRDLLVMAYDVVGFSNGPQGLTAARVPCLK